MEVRCGQLEKETAVDLQLRNAVREKNSGLYEVLPLKHEYILMELKTESIIDCIKCYQENWRSHMIERTLEDFRKQFYDIDLRGKDDYDVR
jgi:hypothetical protein